MRDPGLGSKTLAAVFGWVQGRRVFRGFTTQPQWVTEGVPLLKQFLRRIAEPF